MWTFTCPTIVSITANFQAAENAGKRTPNSEGLAGSSAAQTSQSAAQRVPLILTFLLEKKLLTDAKQRCANMDAIVMAPIFRLQVTGASAHVLLTAPPVVTTASTARGWSLPFRRRRCRSCRLAAREGRPLDVDVCSFLLRSCNFCTLQRRCRGSAHLNGSFFVIFQESERLRHFFVENVFLHFFEVVQEEVQGRCEGREGEGRKRRHWCSCFQLCYLDNVFKFFLLFVYNPQRASVCWRIRWFGFQVRACG